MKGRGRILIPAAAAALAVAFTATATRAQAPDARRVMTIQESLLLPSWGGYTLSPDGTMLAFTISERDEESWETTSHIHLYEIATGAMRQLTNSEDGETGPEWLPDGRLMFSSNRGEEGRTRWVISPNGGEATRYLEDEDAPDGGSFNADFTRIAYTETTDRPDQEEWDQRREVRDDAYYAELKLTYSHIWVYDVESGEKKQLTSGQFDHSGPTWSPDGRWIAFTSNRTGTRMGDPDRLANTDILIVPADSGEVRLLTTNPGPDGSPRWSPDGTRIAYTSSDRVNHNADHTDLKVLSLAGGGPLNLTADFDYSVGSIEWAPGGDALYFTAAEGLGSRTYRIPVDGGDPVPVLPDDEYVYGIADRLEDDSRWVVTGSSLSDPGSVFITDAGGANPRRLFQPNEGLAEFALASAEAIEWTGADGWTIEGVLTYPLDYVEGQRYPLILQVHGGPHGRYSKTFSTGTQIWAARGYAVLQGNPRGSSGRTLEFSAANVGDWGGKDFEDIMAGVDHVIDLGVANPDQMGVMGGSYGGFMTFWTVTQTDRFKGAIGHAGISDWYSFYGQTDIPYLLEFGFDGLPWEAKETYERWSPVEYATDVTTPLLITHGEEDRRVPISQAEQYFRSLKKLGKTVEFLRFPRAGHGISEPRHRIFLDQEQAKWFARHVLGRIAAEEEFQR